MPRGRRATGGQGRSANFADAMARSAERRRCPKCGRKSAMVYHPAIYNAEGAVELPSATACRWGDCGYVRPKPEGSDA